MDDNKILHTYYGKPRDFEGKRFRKDDRFLYAQMPEVGSELKIEHKDFHKAVVRCSDSLQIDEGLAYQIVRNFPLGFFRQV